MHMFEPMLPLSKCIKIEGTAFGTLAKIYLEFEKPFWNDGWLGFSILWKMEQLKELREDPVNGDWLEGFLGFFSFNTYQPNTLSGWINGRLAEKMEEKSDEEIKAGAEKVLRMVLKQWTIPDANAMIRYD